MSEVFKEFIKLLVKYLKTYTIYGKKVKFDSDSEDKINTLYSLILENYKVSEITTIIANYILKNQRINDSHLDFSYSDIPSDSTMLYKFYKENIHNSLTLFSNYIENTLHNDIRTYLYIIIVLIIEDVSNIKQKNVKSLDDFLKSLDHYEKNIKDKNSKIWYRGQTNFDWGLIPSFYRKIDRSEVKYFDKSEIFKKYDLYGLKDKYLSIFKYPTNDYDFFSYMQHSLSYSPLLDFTESFIVACSFALSNKDSVDDFHKNDSVVYAITFSDEPTREISWEEFKVATAINPIEEMKIDDWINLIKIMGKINVSPTIQYLDFETNDRMRYQKGKFVFFSNFVLFGDRVNVKSTTDVVFHRLIIDKKVKLDIYKFINDNYPQYTKKYLMDPYLWFTE